MKREDVTILKYRTPTSVIDFWEQDFQKKVNKLIQLEITINSLKDIIKTKHLKATLWTENRAVDSSDLLIDVPKLKSKSRKKLKELMKTKKEILKKIKKPNLQKVLQFLKEDMVIKQTSNLYFD